MPGWILLPGCPDRACCPDARIYDFARLPGWGLCPGQDMSGYTFLPGCPYRRFCPAARIVAFARLPGYTLLPGCPDRACCPAARIGAYPRIGWDAEVECSSPQDYAWGLPGYLLLPVCPDRPWLAARANDRVLGPVAGGSTFDAHATTCRDMLWLRVSDIAVLPGCPDRLKLRLPGYNFLPGCPYRSARILPGYLPPGSMCIYIYNISTHICIYICT